MRQHFGRYRIDSGLYQDRISDDLSSDPDDRVHAAAVICGDVNLLLTQNMKHPRTKPVLAAEVVTSDEFFVDLLNRRQAVIESFTRAAASKKNPPVSAHELADKIAAAGAPRFTERLRPHLVRE